MYSLPSFHWYQNDAWFASILTFYFFQVLSSANEYIHLLSGWWAFELFPGICYHGQISYKHSCHVSCCLCANFSWVYTWEWNCWISGSVRHCQSVFRSRCINLHSTSSAWEVSGICTFWRLHTTACYPAAQMNERELKTTIMWVPSMSEWARGGYMGRATL